MYKRQPLAQRPEKQAQPVIFVTHTCTHFEPKESRGRFELSVRVACKSLDRKLTGNKDVAGTPAEKLRFRGSKATDLQLEVFLRQQVNR